MLADDVKIIINSEKQIKWFIVQIYQVLAVHDSSFNFRYLPNSYLPI